MADTKFKPGDKVRLLNYSCAPSVNDEWRKAFIPLVGTTVAILRANVVVGGITWWVVDRDHPTSFTTKIAWPDIAMILADQEEHPTLRNMSAVKPQWLIAREVCIAPNECRKCGAPSTPDHPCQYHGYLKG